MTIPLRRYTYLEEGNNCSYWPGKNLRTLFAKTDYKPGIGSERQRLFAGLSRGGFPAVDSLVIPACIDCPTHQKCIAVRIDNKRFYLSRSQRKTLEEIQRFLTFEVYEHKDHLPQHNYARLRYMLENYLWDRHKERYTRTEIKEKYNDVLDETDSLVIGRTKLTKQIMTCAFIAKDPDSGSVYGAKIIYDNTDPSFMKLSPGISTMLTAVHHYKQRSPNDYFHLGALSPGSPTLGYKIRFRGLEFFYNDQWNTEPPPQVRACDLKYPALTA